jgi:hypothetical protein
MNFRSMIRMMLVLLVVIIIYVVREYPNHTTPMVNRNHHQQQTRKRRSDIPHLLRQHLDYSDHRNKSNSSSLVTSSSSSSLVKSFVDLHCRGGWISSANHMKPIFDYQKLETQTMPASLWNRTKTHVLNENRCYSGSVFVPGPVCINRTTNQVIFYQTPTLSSFGDREETWDTHWPEYPLRVVWKNSIASLSPYIHVLDMHLTITPMVCGSNIWHFLLDTLGNIYHMMMYLFVLCFFYALRFLYALTAYVFSLS